MCQSSNKWSCMLFHFSNKLEISMVYRNLIIKIQRSFKCSYTILLLQYKRTAPVYQTGCVIWIVPFDVFNVRLMNYALHCTHGTVLQKFMSHYSNLFLLKIIITIIPTILNLPLHSKWRLAFFIHFFIIITHMDKKNNSVFLTPFTDFDHQILKQSAFLNSKL